MKPIKKYAVQGELLKPWLEQLITPNHQLVLLGNSIDWSRIEKEFDALFSEDRGAHAKPVRLIVGLLMLQHMYDYSDEGVVETWIENPYWQYFCGELMWQNEAPINPSSLPRWRKRIKEAGMKTLLSLTIEAALDTGAVKVSSLGRTIVDTTVMEKNITFPTDSKTQYTAIKYLAKMAKEHGVSLNQTYVIVGKKRLVKANRYNHARQAKRAKKERKKIKTYLGRLYRSIKRKIEGNKFLECVFKDIFEIVEKLLTQTTDSKNKIYSVHEPHVECIAKGKTHKKYEFGCKASLVITHKEGLVLSAEALHGTPYDGHTLKKALEDAENNFAGKIREAYVDKGYKGHAVDDKTVYISGQKKRVTKWFRKLLKRRQAIEPHIGHMKSDGKLGRNFLKGKLGDKLNILLCGIGHNLRLIARHLRYIALAPS